MPIVFSEKYLGTKQSTSYLPQFCASIRFFLASKMKTRSESDLFQRCLRFNLLKYKKYKNAIIINEVFRNAITMFL